MAASYKSPRKLKFAVSCSSNMNRSMEAHLVLQSRNFDITSYGTGNTVKLPGPAIDKPNVYEFETTSYDYIFKDLRKKDPRLYHNNGLLGMLERNRKIKKCPQKFQRSSEKFDVIICLEERVYDQVLDFMYTKPSVVGDRVHIINVDITDNPQDATVGAQLVARLCQELEQTSDLDDDMDEILTTFEVNNQNRNIINTICFY